MKKILFLLLLFIPLVTNAESVYEEIIIDKSLVLKSISKTFILKMGDKKFAIFPDELKRWVKFRAEGDTNFMTLVPSRIDKFFETYVAPSIDDNGDNARFVLKEGGYEMKASARNGKILDSKKTTLSIRNALKAGRSSAMIYTKVYQPPVANIKQFNKLGLTDHLAQGVTSFSGSPSNRIKNIDVGRLRFQGVLIAPGAELSVNKYIGPVTQEAGFFPELVIKEHVTVPEYGGGLCQVSTTMFRAAVDAGFEITERRNHAYPVQYYGKPGFDATIYQPHPDLKFKNNSGNWVLIQTSIKGKQLFFDFYGKSDGRKVKVDGPHTTEKKSDGTIKTLLREEVTDKSGKVILNTLFKSEYKSADLFPIVRKENGENGASAQ